MSLGNDEVNQEAYHDFLENIRLEEIALLELDVKRDAKLREGRLAVDLRRDFYLIEQKDRKIHAGAYVKIDVANAEGEHAFSITARFSALYESSKEDANPEEFVNMFIERNVPVNVWPYFRELVSSITTRLGYSALLIPPYVVKR